MFFKEDIHRFIYITELFLSDIRGLRYTGFKKVNFSVGHPVWCHIHYIMMSYVLSWYHMSWRFYHKVICQDIIFDYISMSVMTTYVMKSYFKWHDLLCHDIISLLPLCCLHFSIFAQACAVPAVVVWTLSFGWSTAGSDVVATIFIGLLFFSAFFFLRRLFFS